MTHQDRNETLLRKALLAAENAIEEATDIMHYEDGQPVTALEGWEIERAYTALCSVLVEIHEALAIKTPGVHTAGPWITFRLAPDSDPQERLIVVTADGETEICGVISNEADACVIAAALDMLQALEEAEYALRNAADQYAVDRGRRSAILDGRLQIIRAAILRAKPGA